MFEDIPSLKVEPMDEGSPLLLLVQDDGGSEDRIVIHPVHVRYLAERIGLAEASDLEASRTIAKLERRLQTLALRIEQLADRLETGEAPQAPANARALSDLAQEFCTDLDAFRLPEKG